MTIRRAATLGDIAVIGGQLVSPTQEPYSGMPHVGPEDIESGTGRLLQARTAKELGLISAKYVFDETAIVYSKVRPNLNKVVRPGFSGLCSADAYPIWPRQDVDTSFLFHFLRSAPFLKQVLRTSARTGMPKVNREDLQRVALVIPSKPMQKRIGEVGDEFDRQIALVAALVDRFAHLSRSVQADIFGERRRAGGFGATRWKPRRFSEFLQPFTEENAGERREMLSCSKIHGILRQSEKFENRPEPPDMTKYKVVRRGDLVVDRMLLWDGSLAFVERVSEGVVSPDYSTFSFNGDERQRQFFKALLKSGRARHLYRALARGSNTRRRRVVPADFLAIAISMPDEDEQRVLGDLFLDFERILFLLERKKHTLGREKAAVMHKLFAS